LFFSLAVAACSGGGATPDAPLAGDAQTGPVDAGPDATPITGNILEDLRAIPGMEVTERTTSISNYRFFSLVYQQPVDHHNPAGPTFGQRIMLMHRTYQSPTVLVTNGYHVLAADGRYEPTQLVSGNQVSVEHRFFEPSRPDPTDWTKLDIWQAASDHHRIVQAFRRLYPGRWLNTGASKSGMAAIYHRRFYPDDVDGTVAYVAPLSFAAGDERYVTFVDNAGPSAACRQDLRDFQRLVLEHRTSMLESMSTTGATFETLGADKALEHATLELPFALWQYSSAAACSRIPASNATNSAIFSFLDDISDVAAYGDAEIERFGPYYYQAAHQLGYPQIDEEPVSDLLLHPGTDDAEEYLPEGTSVTYDPAVMRDIDTWVKTSGKRLLFIYGEYDPWTAGAFELGNATQSLKLIVPAGNHSASISRLTDADKTRATNLINSWLGISLAPGKPVTFDDPTLVEPRRRGL